MEQTLEQMSRKELIQEAKKKADELGMSMPFGGKKNEEYMEMARTGKGLIPNDVKRKGKMRVPLGGLRQKLAVPDRLKDSAHNFRIFNDNGARLQEALDAGYEFVYDKGTDDADEYKGTKDGIGTKVSYHVGPGPDGKPMKGYLMKIRKDWYEEDQAEKQKIVDDIDRAIKGGDIGEAEKRYIPSSGITLTNS